MSHFHLLWSNYPNWNPCNARKETGKDTGALLFGNQCAIRLSYALKKSGVSFATFPAGRKCWVHKGADEVLAARELADWLDKGNGRALKIAQSEKIANSEWRDKVLDRKGIICFENYYPSNARNPDVIDGDHIDLWDGNSLTAFGSWLRIRFNIVIPGIWSDFRKSNSIRFFAMT